MVFLKRKSVANSGTFLLILLSRSLADETCDVHSERCNNGPEFNHKRIKSPWSPLNIASTLALNDGNTIPIFGLGVYLAAAGEETHKAVHWALEKGYRQIDTATRYNNEESVGEAIRKSEIPREDIFVVTKLYDDNHGYDETLTAFNKSLERLRLDYVDLYLIHSPLPDKVVPSWSAMIELQQRGSIR